MFAGRVAGQCIQEAEASIEVLLLSVLKGSGTSHGTPLSRSAKVNCVSFLTMKLNTLRQLFTFRFLPYVVPSHEIFSTFSDEVLLDETRMFAGDSKFEGDMGRAARLPMLSERRGRLAARTASEYKVHSIKQKNMVCKSRMILPLACQGKQISAQEKEASSVTSREALNFVFAPMDAEYPTSVILSLDVQDTSSLIRAYLE